MVSIKRALIVLGMLLIAACAQLPGGEDTDDRSAEGMDPNSAATEQLPFVKIPRPKGDSSVNVSGTAKSEFAAAKAAMANEKWEEARDRLLLMSETYANLAGVYTNLGIVYAKLEQAEKAEQAYQFALKTNQYNFDAYTNLGLLYREQGKFAQAEQTYRDALALWPHHQASLINLGILYDLYLGRLQLALEQYELAQKLNEREDRQLKGWIIDLQRRISAQAG